MHDEKAVITGPDGSTSLGRLLSKDNKLHGIIRRALTLTANVSIISGDDQEGAADKQLP